jgi:hypothetical protein
VLCAFAVQNIQRFKIVEDAKSAMAEFVLDFILEFIAYGTGELLLYIVTLGTHKPEWPYSRKNSGVIQEFFFQRSTWLGIIFWVAVLVFVAWLLS